MNFLGPPPVKVNLLLRANTTTELHKCCSYRRVWLRGEIKDEDPDALWSRNLGKYAVNRGDGVLGILKRLQGEGLPEVSAAEMPPNVM